jgi:hypothetical protein
VEGKDKTAWAAFAKALEEHHGNAQTITELSIDMSVAVTRQDKRVKSGQ